jgi:hypothetical protein
MTNITRGHSMTYNLFHNAYQVHVQKSEYRNGGIAIQLIDAEDGTPFATATIWVEGLAENEVAIKNYSENLGMLTFLVTNGIVEQPHRQINNGFVNIPICKLK